MRSPSIFVAALLTLAAPAAWSAPEGSDEPPGRVGRVSYTIGSVSLYADPERNWEKAYVNSPLTSENSLWTEPRARAEVRIGSTALRLDETTQLDMRRLGDMELRAHVVRGSLSVFIRDFDRSERYEISTPNATFILTGAGRYRIDSDGDRGDAALTVFAGTAEVDASRRTAVRAGDTVRVLDDGARIEFERLANTPFDDWALARDDRVGRGNVETVRYVSPHMTGYEELEGAGSWAQEPDYGAVWYPARVSVDYVPYRDGRWVYTRPWGWTWVDNAPWGYAPFHYGRWVYVGNRWGWCPGRYQPRPVWAPALVSFVGAPGFSVSVSSGRAPAMGWYPLSPWDHYRPWYTNNTTYINNVNVIVNRPPRGRDQDRDRNRERATTVILREDFVQQRPVAAGMTRVSGESVREAARAPIAANPVAVLPTRGEVRHVPSTQAFIPSNNPSVRVGGETVGGAPANAPAAQPQAGTSGRGNSKPVFTPGGSVPVATPAPVIPAPQQAQQPVQQPPRVGGEAVRQDSRAAKPASPPPPPVPVAQPQPQLQPQQQPQSAPAFRGRPPSTPVEVREQPAPQQQQQPQARPQPQHQQPQQPQQPQQQQQPQGGMQAKPAQAKPEPKPEAKPEKEKPEKEKPEKPGAGGREK
ncbi:hypothetical protein BWI17_12080 [Betaproteobacteria bacterium GR16-43]|nr:hypothetical protein BWI17_12080 [Betaproteobacteria bacterium GR16-43]